MSMTTAKDMLTLNEVSRELNRSFEQVRRYVREGRLRAYKIGLQGFVLRSDLKEFKSTLQNKKVDGSNIVERARVLRERIKAHSGEIDVLSLLDETRKERLEEL